MTDPEFRARMRRSWRFDHAYLLDERDALKAALLQYVEAMQKADAFERSIITADEVVASMMRSIDNNRHATPREDVLEWFE